MFMEKIENALLATMLSDGALGDGVQLTRVNLQPGHMQQDHGEWAYFPVDALMTWVPTHSKQGAVALVGHRGCVAASGPKCACAGACCIAWACVPTGLGRGTPRPLAFCAMAFAHHSGRAKPHRSNGPVVILCAAPQPFATLGQLAVAWLGAVSPARVVVELAEPAAGRARLAALVRRCRCTGHP